MTRKTDVPQIPYFLVILVIMTSLLAGIFYTPIKKPDCEIVESKSAATTQYNNYLRKFAISIPSEQKIERRKCDDSLLLSIQYSTDSGDHKIEIGLHEKVKNMELLDQISLNRDTKTVLSKQESVKVSGRDAIHEVGTGLGGFEAFHILNGENVITIVRYFMEYSPDPVFDSIVQSFKAI